MDTTSRHRLDLWTVQAPGWALLIYLAVAQGITAFSYSLGVAMGTQEPVAAVTEVGVAYWHGFAIGDVLVYIPLLLVGLLLHRQRSRWSPAVLGSALGITIYWPIVSLAALVRARGAAGWTVADETPYWIVCLGVALWGCWALWLVARGASEGGP